MESTKLTKTVFFFDVENFITCLVVIVNKGVRTSVFFIQMDTYILIQQSIKVSNLYFKWLPVEISESIK